MTWTAAISRFNRGVAVVAILPLAISCGRPASSGVITPVPTAAKALDGPITIPLRRYQGRLRSITAAVGGVPREFLFDTGGGWTLISPEVAERAQCVSGARSVGYRMSGERLDVPLCSAPTEMSFGTMRDGVTGAGIFDLMALLPAGWPKLDGVVSMHTFARRAITLDLANDRLIIESAQSLADRSRQMVPLRARLATGNDGASLVVFLAVRAGEADLWLEFDSGNLDDVILAPHAAKALSLTGRDTGTVDLVLAPSVTVPARARAREIIYDGVINAALIERGVYTFDLARGRAWFRANDSPQEGAPITSSRRRSVPRPRPTRR